MSYDWGRTMSEDTDKPARLPTAQQDLMNEPYAWVDIDSQLRSKQTSPRDIPLYTKPEWQGLTDDEIHDCFQNRGRGSDGLKTRKLIAAAIEAMLKEKNNG
jgi:hypothetical protein